MLSASDTYDPMDASQENKWGFAFLSIGDCKAFHWKKSDGTITDLTAMNRQNVANATDPGGRIGPYVGQGAPDLRNLKLYFYGCDEGCLECVK
jgi:hypothetical protein